MSPGPGAAAPSQLGGVSLDASFGVVPLPGRLERSPSGPFDLGDAFDVDLEPTSSTYLVRAEVDDDRLDAIRSRPEVEGVYADIEIQPTIVCPGDPAVGTDADVEALLDVVAMRSCGMDGTGVLVAVVDTGFNLAYLQSRGKNPGFDAARSWSFDPVGQPPGQVAVSHGTMCAYDVCIAAPACTLLDVVLLRPLSAPPGGSIMSGLLSDAVKAYSHLIGVMSAPQRPGENRSLVVNNSWGMFHPSWDFPVGDPGNYSDNPNHPFNKIVGSLERAGADILFAAGNCGPDCADGRCQGVTANAIYGANGHPQVLCVAGVDTTKARVGYSTIGPGRLTPRKPDLAGYTHFKGSGVYPADGGTSAATPVVAGVVAAVRSKRPYSATDAGSHPAAVRSLLTSTAQDLGVAGYDFRHGYGVVDAVALRRKLCPPVDLCKRFPWLPWCDPCRLQPGSLRCLCKRFPHLPICRFLPAGAEPGGVVTSVVADGDVDLAAALEAAFVAGFEAAGTAGVPEAPPSVTPPAAKAGGCGCGGR